MDTEDIVQELRRPELAREAALACADKPCPTCSGAAAAAEPSYVYALGRIESRFPNLSVEKEFAQAGGRAEAAGLSSQEVVHAVLTKRENRYLVRELGWVLRVQGLETYLLQPRDPLDFDLLIEAIRPRASPLDVDAVIGLRGPVAPPDFCNGLTIPIVRFDQIYSFDTNFLIKAIPRPETMTDERFETMAEEVFFRIMQISDNAGATDEHRALNYLAMRCPSIYTSAAELAGRDFSLAGVEARTPSLGSIHKVVDVVFSYSNRKTDFQEKYSVRVQMGKYPSLVTKLAPYFDR